MVGLKVEEGFLLTPEQLEMLYVKDMIDYKKLSDANANGDNMMEDEIQNALNSIPQPASTPLLDKHILDKAAFQTAIDHPDKWAEIIASHTDMRGPIAYWHALEGDIVKAKNIEELSLLNGKKAELIEIVNAGNEVEINKFNQAFDNYLNASQKTSFANAAVVDVSR